MANPTYFPIATTTVGAGGVASVTFSAIPQTYTDLKLVHSVRSSKAAANDQLTISFNGLTTNFTSRQLEGNGSTVASYTTTGTATNTTDGSTSTANTFDNQEIYIPNYTGSTNKSFSYDGVTENNATAAYQDLLAGLWSNTSAITSISIATTASNFVQYSSFTLYGIRNY